MKCIVVIFCMMLLVISVSAQQTFEKKVYVGAGLISAIPVGIFSSVYSFTLGGSVKAELSVSQKFLCTLNAGYYQFLRKGGGEGIGFIPLLGGFKYHFVPKVFIDVQGGVGFPTVRNTGTAFCFVTGLGYSITKKLEVAGNFTGFGKYGYTIGILGIELAYYF